jgi:sulfite reductase beta subunit-like hemoprotein
LPALFEHFDAAGLLTVELFGATVRHIVLCPVSGIDFDELFDASDLAEEINNYFVHTAAVFADLPRKLKIAVTGCAVRCVYPEVNDIGIFAVPDFERGGVVFRARVGGGLSISPRFSRDLGILIEPFEVVEVCGAIAAVLLQREARQEPRRRASYVVEASETETFLDEVESHLGRELRRTRLDASPVIERDRSHVGIHGQHQNGFYYVGLSLLGGRTSGSGLNRLAELAEQYGAGRLRTTNTQNIVLADIPEWGLANIADELDASGFEYEPSWSRKAVIACTGVEFCNLAFTETKNRAENLAHHLERTAAVADPVRISLTGCGNACGQHQICDVGLEGSTATVDGVRQEAFHILLGGGVGKYETLSRRIGIQIPADELAEALARLFQQFNRTRGEEESFQEFVLRHSDEELTKIIQPVNRRASLIEPPAGLTATILEFCAGYKQ